MQAQQEVQLAGAARNSPLQVPLTVEEPQAIHASSSAASHGNANGLMQEAADAVQQVPHVDASNNAYHDITTVTHLHPCQYQSVFRRVRDTQGRVKMMPHSAVCGCTIVSVFSVRPLQSVFHCMPSSAGWSHSRECQVAVQSHVTYLFQFVFIL